LFARKRGAAVGGDATIPRFRRRDRVERLRPRLQHLAIAGEGKIAVARGRRKLFLSPGSLVAVRHVLELPTLCACGVRSVGDGRRGGGLRGLPIRVWTQRRGSRPQHLVRAGRAGHRGPILAADSPGTLSGDPVTCVGSARPNPAGPSSASRSGLRDQAYPGTRRLAGDGDRSAPD
jgi:hypothetical protein